MSIAGIPFVKSPLEITRHEGQITHPVSVSAARIMVAAPLWDQIEAEIQTHPRSAIRTLCQILDVETPRAHRFTPGKCYARAFQPDISIVDLEGGRGEPAEYVLESFARTDDFKKTGNGIRLALQKYAQRLLHPDFIISPLNADKPHDIYLALHGPYHTVKYARLERAGIWRPSRRGVREFCV